jgi:carbon storage regulator
MLVLSRRIGEEIVIAGNILVTVVAIKGQRIRLGITAPPSVPVTRRELLPGSSAPARTPTNDSRAESAEGRGANAGGV